MQIIKDQQLSENTWRFIADDAPLTNGNITVSLQRWTQDKAQLLQHGANIGVRLAPADLVETLADDLSAISLIELNFPAFNDGRCFSQARLLRGHYGYQGEIRAVGNYMADQVFYLHRVGVNAFEFSNPQHLDLALSAINDFSVRYQPSTL
ncbi:MAG: oxidoreductase [Methylomonas sp.]|nr:MAG: oxidoreductase [Methylomonas sp.]